MDFSSLNPLTSNSLSLATRNNNVKEVATLLKTANPNCTDNRGWTCLHEAAANDSFQSLLLILQHKDTKPLTITPEGCTALYLACQQMSSIETIHGLLRVVPGIVNVGNTDSETPLHIVCSQRRLDVLQLLLDYGAEIDVQDFDGNSPLHDAALGANHVAVNILLHAGAIPDITNESDYVPLHFACYSGCIQTVKNLYAFTNNVNQETLHGDTPLILAAQNHSDDVIKFLLEVGADPHYQNNSSVSPLTTAVETGHLPSVEILWTASNPRKIPQNLIQFACQPHIFKMEILEYLLAQDLDTKFFLSCDKFNLSLEQIGIYCPIYVTSAPINCYLNVCEYIHNQSHSKFREFFYLFLMRGLLVDAVEVYECPPLVYIHYCSHTFSFNDVFIILRENGCNVDYISTRLNFGIDRYISDALHASLSIDPKTLPVILTHSLYCDPEYLLRFAIMNSILDRIPQNVVKELLMKIGNTDGSLTAESLSYTALSLKHLSRQKIRSLLRSTGKKWKTTNEFFNILNQINIPQILKNYLRFV